MKYKKIYLLSGLGVDGRVFEKIDLKEYQPQLVEWIQPYAHEDITAYAKRLSAQMEPNAILIGLSFGGMLAVEIAKFLPIHKIILVSSASNFKQIPWLFRLWDWSKLLGVLPQKIMLKANFITFWLFGITRTQEKILLSQILADTNTIFLIWAVRQITKWKNTKVNTKFVHLHGTNDRLLQLPMENLKTNNILIKNGGHFMIITHAHELERIIRKELKGF